jgi:hypothetical protein
MAAMRGSWVDMEWSTRCRMSRRTRGWRQTRSSLPVTVPALGQSGVASVELRRRLLDALVLLPIRMMVRITRLDKTRRTDGVRGLGVYGNTRVDGVPKLFSGEISSSFDLAA